MDRYDGKNVVITGGSTGLGLATARYLVDRGARVIITGRNQDTLDDAARRLGDDAIAIRSDTSSLPDIDALATRVKSEFGGVDVLVLNAGISSFDPIDAVTEQTFDEVFAINTKGPFFTVQKFLPLLAAGGSIVVVTSVSNTKGMPLTSVYSATKAALRSFTRTLAGELVGRGIRVNAVSPGPVDTGILERTLPAAQAQEFLAQLKADNPMGRLGQPEEIAKAIAFLGFDATYTTGTELLVDGGASDL